MIPVNLIKCTAFAAATLTLAGCGGGGGTGTDPSQNINPPPPVDSASQTYLGLRDTSVGETSTLTGTILGPGSTIGVAGGTLNHDAQTISISGQSGTFGVDDGSGFSIGTFDYATDLELGTSQAAVVGVATAEVDMPTTGELAYTGRFSAQLTDTSLITAQTLNWDADVQVNFATSDVDMTFSGPGTLIDEIQINNASISGNRFSGGTIGTSLNGVQNNITGTTAQVGGGFFGYNATLAGSPRELGGALQSDDADTDIRGVFVAAN